jgi:hypothetical protein
MRLLYTIVAAVSLLLLIFVAYFGARSLRRYEGTLTTREVVAPIRVTASGNNRTEEIELYTQTSGWVSYRGRLTYLSIANPVRGQEEETWSRPASDTAGTWPMALAAEVRSIGSIGWGSGKTVGKLRDPLGITWRLPYSYFTVPYWLLAVLTAVLPALWGRSFYIAVQRERRGQCVRCGTSVKGLTGNCPKCGEPIPA